MEIILIRHGLTAGNLKKAYIGRTDESLCAEGRAAIQQAGGFPGVSKVIVRPLCRAREPASLLFPGATQQVVADLREMDFGLFEGRTANEMEHDPLYRQWVKDGCLSPCPGGEGKAGFSQRVCQAFAQVVQQAIDNREKQLILVSHGGPIMAIMERYALPSQGYWQWHTQALGGWRAEVDEAGWEETPQLADCTPMEVICL
jgi:alpha-ribazole phosphatase